MFFVRLVFSLCVALAFSWLGLWLIGSMDLSARLALAGAALLVGAPAWAMVANGVLKRVLEPELAPAPELAGD